MAATLAAAAPPATPNIVLITLDTTRADRMGFLGSKSGLTPNLDELAKQSAVFARAIRAGAVSRRLRTRRSSTARIPQFNHIEDLGSPLATELPYLPDILHRRGYRTAAFVGAMILDPVNKGAPGFERGFDKYDAGFHRRRPGEPRYTSVERRAGDVVDRALAWRQATDGAVFCGCIFMTHMTRTIRRSLIKRDMHRRRTTARSPTRMRRWGSF